MTTLALMRSRIDNLTNNRISEVDIDELINRVHQEEVESGEWSYRQKRFMLQSDPIKTGGTVTVSQGGRHVTGTGTAFTESDVGRYIRLGAQFEIMPIPITDVMLFPDAIGFESLVVTSSDVQTINSAYGGVLATKAAITVLGGNIRYTIDGTPPTPTTGHQILEGSQFQISGHTNLDNFQMIAVSVDAEVTITAERDMQGLLLEYPWPDLTVTDGTYEIFTRYYTMPANVDTITRINHVDITLKEWTPFEIDLYDPNRREREDTAYRYARAGWDDNGRLLLELWPVTDTAKLYQVEYLAGHTPLVNDADRPLVPATLLESRALQDACYVLYAKTGDDKWIRLADKHERSYTKALERLAPADTTRFGKLDQVLDLDGLGYSSSRALGYPYMVNHDV